MGVSSPSLDGLIASVRQIMVSEDTGNDAGMDADPAHDFEHVMRVYRNVQTICNSERMNMTRSPKDVQAGREADEKLTLAAALLHDIVRRPKTDVVTRAAAACESADAAKEILAEHGFCSEEIAAVSDAIRDHSFSRGTVPKTPEGKILQDADRLDALGAIGIARVFATGGALGRPFYSASNPFCVNRAPDDNTWTIDHFFQKLLKLESMMNTESGRKEAQDRTDIMRLFLEQIRREILI